MNWKNIIKQLVASGLSEEAIARELSRVLPEPVRQPTINRLKNRKTKNPSYALGKALIDLHSVRVGSSSRRKPAHAHNQHSSPPP